MKEIEFQVISESLSNSKVSYNVEETVILGNKSWKQKLQRGNKNTPHEKTFVCTVMFPS